MGRSATVLKNFLIVLLIFSKASQMMDKYGLDHFFTTYLFEERVCDPKEYEIIYNLINKKIFEPISKKKEY